MQMTACVVIYADEDMHTEWYADDDMYGDVHAWRANVCRCNADEDMYGDVCRWGHVWRCMPMYADAMPVTTCMAI